MIGKVYKDTKVKICGAWGWRCKRCNKEHSYLDKRCGCKGVITKGGGE